MTFDIVVAVDQAWGIGKGNQIPWPRLSGDMKQFKLLTSTASEGRTNAIIMGRKTWDSMGGKPLPKRKSVVISRAAQELAGASLVRSFDEALVASANCEATFVIGGGEIYRMALEHVELRWVYLTRVDGTYACDVTFPAIDFKLDPSWAVIEGRDNDVDYRIERLQRG